MYIYIYKYLIIRRCVSTKACEDMAHQLRQGRQVCRCGSPRLSHNRQTNHNSDGFVAQPEFAYRNLATRRAPNYTRLRRQLINIGRYAWRKSIANDCPAYAEYGS